jgi:hypothetical protein
MIVAGPALKRSGPGFVAEDSPANGTSSAIFKTMSGS